jgi:hypothetical protein
MRPARPPPGPSPRPWPPPRQGPVARRLRGSVRSPPGPRPDRCAVRPGGPVYLITRYRNLGAIRAEGTAGKREEARPRWLRLHPPGRTPPLLVMGRNGRGASAPAKTPIEVIYGGRSVTLAEWDGRLQAWVKVGDPDRRALHRVTGWRPVKICPGEGRKPPP